MNVMREAAQTVDVLWRSPELVGSGPWETSWET